MGALGDLRARVAGALAGLAPDGDDWPVFDGPVDSLTPPAFVLVYPEPWLTPSTVCAYTAAVQVVVVVARIDPAPGYDQVDALLEAALPALQEARVVVGQVGAPGQLEVGGVQYQAARITVSAPLTFGGS